MERPQAEMLKNMAFWEREPKEIFQDEHWTISEALCIYSLLLRKTPDDLEFDAYFRLLYALLMTGIDHHEVKLVDNVYKKIKPAGRIFPKPISSAFLNPFSLAFLDLTSLVAETCEPINIYKLSIDRNFIKIKLSDLKKCVAVPDVIAFFTKNGIDVRGERSNLPSIEQLRSQIETLKSADQNSFGEQQTNSPENELSGTEAEKDDVPPVVDREALIKQIRSEVGKKNGEKWRAFIAHSVKPLVKRELDLGCLCLHGAMAERLTKELSDEAKRSFNPKEYCKISGDLPDKIEKGIKKIFYDFGDEYDHVQSRVYRGKYYDKEYDHRPCSLHSGK